MSMVRRLGCAALAAAALALAGPATAAEPKVLSDEVIPYKGDSLPARTRPLFEVGPALLGTGPLGPGIELPTGAVWQPALWVFGEARTAVGIYKNNSAPEVQEWANRLDLLANLRLSGTERFLVGFSPLRDGTRFSGYHRSPEERRGFDSEFSAEPTVLFFEGEIGEIFPDADPFDTGGLDLGFTVGRQQLLFQEGVLINDTVDAVALTRDTIVLKGVSVDTRLTGLFSWADIHRSDNVRDDSAQLFGVFSETDFRAATVAVDAILVDGGSSGAGSGNGSTDGAFFGIGSTQSLGPVNTAFRAVQSVALQDRSAAVDTGTVLFAELNGDPLGTSDVLYANAAWAIGRFTSAARDPLVGGPLGQVGILFASAGLGDYGTALGNRAEDVVAGAVGYQMFFNDERTQLVAEVGGRVATEASQRDAAAVGLRLQQAIGDRYVVQLDSFVAREEASDFGYGARTEFLVRF